MACGPTVCLCVIVLTISCPTSGFVLPKGSVPATGSKDPAASSVGFDLMDWYTLMAVNMLTKAKQEPSFNLPVATTPVTQLEQLGLQAKAQQKPVNQVNQAEEPSQPVGQVEEPVQAAGVPEELIQSSNQTEEPAQAPGVPEEPVAPNNQTEEPVLPAGLPEEPLQSSNQTEEPGTPGGQPEETIAFANQTEEPVQSAGLPEEPAQPPNQPEEPAPAVEEPKSELVSQANQTVPSGGLPVSLPIDILPVINQTEQIAISTNQTQDAVSPVTLPVVPTATVNQSEVGSFFGMSAESSIPAINQSVEPVVLVSPAIEPFQSTNVSEIAVQSNTTFVEATTVPSNVTEPIVLAEPSPSQTGQVMSLQSKPEGVAGQQSASVGSLNPLDQIMMARLMSSQTVSPSPGQQPIYIPYWMKPVIIAYSQPTNNIEKMLQMALNQI